MNQQPANVLATSNGAVRTHVRAVFHASVWCGQVCCWQTMKNQGVGRNKKGNENVK